MEVSPSRIPSSVIERYEQLVNRRCIRSGAGTHLNIQHYKQRLIDLEKAQSACIGQEADQSRGELLGSRAICRDVMRDELAEEWPAGRFRSRRRVTVARTSCRRISTRRTVRCG